MALHVGSNKIKDTGAYGVYFCPGKTNCLTYTPKNVNLTLSNGTLTLKAGSKVYVPNGKNADGSLKFDEVVVGSGIVDADFGNGQREVAFLMTKNTAAQFSVWPNTIVVSGTSTPDFSSTGYWGVWYDTTNNIIKIQDGTNEWKTLYGFSLPFCLVSSSSSAVTSVDQTFDWCGYIGSTAFVLPGVKGLIPNGFNADGTYKNIEWTSNGVITKTLAYGAQNYYWGVQDAKQDISFYGKTITYYDSKTNTIVDTYPDPDVTRYGWMFLGECVGDSSNKITSLTPCSVKTTNDLQAINAIYNGSQKVYQYLPTGKTFNPSGSFQTYVVPKGVNKLQVDCVAAKGNGNGYGGRVQCVLSVTPGQTLYLAVGRANTSAGTPTYNASDIRTNNAGITNTTSLQSRLVVAGGGGNTGNQAGTGGHGGGLTGAAGSDVDGKSGKGGTQTGGGAGGGTGFGGQGGGVGNFGLGGTGGHGVAGAGGAGWYGGGGGGTSAWGSTLGGNGGGGSSYTNSSRCTNVVHTQGYRNGNGYITLTPVR